MNCSQAPCYESRWLRATSGDGARAIWLRETLLRASTGAASADVWVMVFDPAGHRAHRESFPIDSAVFADDPWTARIGPNSLTDTAAVGGVPGRARWDLTVRPGGEPAVRVLSDRAYQARFPPAKTLVRHPRAQVDGRLEIDGLTVEVDGWVGSVNHNWGSRHTAAYAYGQVCAFDDSPGTTLEIVTARAAVGPVLLPAVTLFVLRHAGMEFAVRTVVGSLQTHGRYEPFTWSFGARVGEQTIEGEIAAATHDVIGLTYTDTGGAEKYCYNSALATCRLQVAGISVPRTELTSSAAMFEILGADRVAGVPLLV
ncbi:hypothetical protein [Mycobacterium sp. PSTR-4-N]|uniref:hypothetical protein n=1 Tax=Mycobacterium sp. PSTR-4-N TaxID=2917745 RepID=UPI001F14BD1A|nr:hypothetical protein [Mycobacterium sp. PSTR-4-N]MCG7597092.1 hypothetical protein [Mycobacterium sp. PSTR-4-N]